MLMEIQLQCRSALLAAADLDGALQLHDSDRIWYSIHGLLAASGNLSKLLWPTRAASRARGVRLRELLEVHDNSPLRMRTMRDIFEHYDEQLEDWASSSKRHIIVDQGVLPAGAIDGVDPGDYLRNLDPTVMEVSFRGKRVQLQPLVNAIVALRESARAEVAREFLTATGGSQP